MPGYVLHLTAARMFLNRLPGEHPFCKDKILMNDFYIGNLLPDTVKDKSRSHFRDPMFWDRMMEWPHPKKFVRKYREHMDEAVYQGFWLHLYVDKRFFRDYIPKVSAFYDSDGRITDKREETERVFLKKQRESVTVDQYLSEQYYYGDYTRMNNWLWERFHLPEDLEPGEDPGIQEADYSAVGRILGELEEYRKVPADAVKQLQVFDAGELVDFLEDIVTEAMKQGFDA